MRHSITLHSRPVYCPVADLAGTKRDAKYSKNELSIERHQKSVLQSKVNALESEMQSTRRELQDLENEAKEKLTTAGDHVKQTRQEVAGLKAKVRPFLYDPLQRCPAKPFKKVLMFSLSTTWSSISTFLKLSVLISVR